jgi:hypothetical protein
MGYAYGYSAAGRMALACDSCGKVGNVRKRTCVHRVEYPQDGAAARTLPYCQPPALCAPCLKDRGGIRALHAGCEEGARLSTAEHHATAARIAAGDLQVMTAWGSWHAAVPEGMTGVMFARSRTAGWPGQTYRLVPADHYQNGGFLADYPGAQPWNGPDGA